MITNVQSQVQSLSLDGNTKKIEKRLASVPYLVLNSSEMIHAYNVFLAEGKASDKVTRIFFILVGFAGAAEGSFALDYLTIHRMLRENGDETLTDEKDTKAAYQEVYRYLTAIDEWQQDIGITFFEWTPGCKPANLERLVSSFQSHTGTLGREACRMAFLDSRYSKHPRKAIHKAALTIFREAAKKGKETQDQQPRKKPSAKAALTNLNKAISGLKTSYYKFTYQAAKEEWDIKAMILENELILAKLAGLAAHINNNVSDLRSLREALNSKNEVTNNTKHCWKGGDTLDTSSEIQDGNDEVALLTELIGDEPQIYFNFEVNSNQSVLEIKDLADKQAGDDNAEIIDPIPIGFADQISQNLESGEVDDEWEAIPEEQAAGQDSPKDAIEVEKSGELEYKLTFFDGKNDSVPKPFNLTWPEFLQLLEQPDIRPEKDGAAFSPATFKEPHRLNANVTELSMLALDYDAGDLVKDLQLFFDLGCQFAVYTSHSHRKSDNDRFRVVIPLAKPIPASLYPALWERFYEMTSKRIDRSAKDPARLWYLPAISNENAPFYFKVFDGDLFDYEDLDLLLPDKPSGQAATSSIPLAKVVSPLPSSVLSLCLPNQGVKYYGWLPNYKYFGKMPHLKKKGEVDLSDWDFAFSLTALRRGFSIGRVVEELRRCRDKARDRLDYVQLTVVNAAIKLNLLPSNFWNQEGVQV